MKTLASQKDTIVEDYADAREAGDNALTKVDYQEDVIETFENIIRACNHTNRSRWKYQYS
jgi:hypothetical protein